MRLKPARLTSCFALGTLLAATLPALANDVVEIRTFSSASQEVWSAWSDPDLIAQ